MAGYKQINPAVGKDTQFKPGRSGNPAGKPVGTISLSNIVQKLLEDPEFAEKVVEKKEGWWQSLPNKNLAEAMTTAMILKAIDGDKMAAEWVRKTGFGDKLTIDHEDDLFDTQKLEVQVVYPKSTQSEPESNSDNST